MKKINKKLKWTLIGLGIFISVSVLIAITFFIYFFVQTGVEVLHEEFTPETKVPIKSEENSLTKETEETTAGSDLIIDDLAYIKILGSSYTDDADPETDGISIDISFYNSKSENISFYNIPIKVNIKLYTTEFNLDTGEFETVKPLVYEGTVELDHSMRLSEMFGNYIRVPFEDVGPISDEKSKMGVLIVRVITPLQGEFGAKQDWLILEPY